VICGYNNPIFLDLCELDESYLCLFGCKTIFKTTKKKKQFNTYLFYFIFCKMLKIFLFQIPAHFFLLIKK